jgi:hypothetical protein
MSTDATPPPAEPGPDATIEDIQADIDQTRTNLGETVEALAAKADVTGRAKQKARETTERVVEKAHVAQSAARNAVNANSGRMGARLPTAVLIAGITVIGVLWWRRRRQ